MIITKKFVKDMLGDLYRQITIEQDNGSKDSYGQVVPSWETLVTVWAEKDFKGGGEKYEANQRTATNVIDWRIRYYPGITEKMRIVDGSDIYDILHISEEGRKHFLILKAEKKDNGS